MERALSSAQRDEDCNSVMRARIEHRTGLHDLPEQRDDEIVLCRVSTGGANKR